MARRRLIPLLLVGVCAAAGVPGRAESDPAGLPELLELPGQLCSVRYTPGSLDRAASLQRRLDLFALEAERWTRQRLPISAFVLSREEWEAWGATRPYGVGAPAGSLAVALPAWGDEGTVEVWRALLDRDLPLIRGLPIRGTPEEVASLGLADLLGQVDLCRSLVAHFGLRSAEQWITEVAAHACVLSFTRRREPDRYAEVQELFASLGGAQVEPGDLRAFEPSLPLQTYAWYTAQFSAAASFIVDREGRKWLRELREVQDRGGGRLEGAALFERYPVLEEWERARFGDLEPERTGLAAVESVEVHLLESFPVQVRLRLLGSLPDRCTTIAGVRAERRDDLIRVSLETERSGSCPAERRVFEHWVKLDVLGLPAGRYQLVVNGVQSVLELAVDNVVPPSVGSGGDAAPSSRVERPPTSFDFTPEPLVTSGNPPDPRPS